MRLLAAEIPAWTGCVHAGDVVGNGHGTGVRTSGLCGKGLGDVQISDVKHKAFIDPNKAYTPAAAASAVTTLSHRRHRCYFSARAQTALVTRGRSL